MKTVILCGGYGTRIRDVADNIPKPMIPIGQFPILWHIMKFYGSFGHQDFVLCLGYKSQVIKDEIGFPCVVKVITGSYGKGVHLCETRKQFEATMELVDNLGSRKTMIVQEFVSATNGKDLRVLVIGGKVIGAMRRSAPEGDFRANITGGGTGEPFPLTDEIEHMARETARVMGLDIAGVDLLFDTNGYKVCECNSAPGFEGFERYVGVDVAQAMVSYARLRLNLTIA